MSIILYSAFANDFDIILVLEAFLPRDNISTNNACTAY